MLGSLLQVCAVELVDERDAEGIESALDDAALAHRAHMADGHLPRGEVNFGRSDSGGCTRTEQGDSCETGQEHG